MKEAIVESVQRGLDPSTENVEDNVFLSIVTLPNAPSLNNQRSAELLPLNTQQPLRAALLAGDTSKTDPCLRQMSSEALTVDFCTVLLVTSTTGVDL